jgi:hypothetical protein
MLSARVARSLSAHPDLELGVFALSELGIRWWRQWIGGWWLKDESLWLWITMLRLRPHLETVFIF